MEALIEELVEEILLRLPPADPASLLRAAAVCKRWCRIISAEGFHNRFGQRNRAAPMLGFLANIMYFTVKLDEEVFRVDYAARFVPATTFRPRRAELSDCRALDARHGRVLLAKMPSCRALYVWDPVTDDLWELPGLPLPSLFSWNAAVVTVVCGAEHGACDHLVCRRRPFRVVFLDSDDAKMRVHIYSSEAGAWSEPTYGPPSPKHEVEMVPTALVANALCFLIDARSSILKYDLASRSVSVILLPPPDSISDSRVLTTMADGGLGFARVENSKLWVWSLETCPNGDAVWAKTRFIELDTLLRVDASSIINDSIAFAHGVGVLFVETQDGRFSIDLKSGRVREEEWGDDETYGAVVPYVSFYIPVLQKSGRVREEEWGDDETYGAVVPYVSFYIPDLRHIPV